MLASNIEYTHVCALNVGDVDQTEVSLCDSSRGQASFAKVLGRNTQM
jgi:hypothetical protein